ncbi:MAG: DMP19 family protein [Rubripirellula sp.]|nr:DMP19 family protein [Rubripirellula sp.]
MKIAIVVVLMLVIAAVIFFGWSRSRRPGQGSFWDLVRNPDAMPDFDQLEEEVADAAKSMSESSTEVAALVDFFVFEAESSRDAEKELRILAKLGSEAYPRALEILRDPSLQERLVELPDQESSRPESPLNRLCEIFDQDAPPPKEAAVLLAPFLESDSDEIRKRVALIIGSVASTDSLPGLGQAVTDRGEYVRSSALIGIQRAISAGRVEESAKDDLFTVIADMWPGDTNFNVCDSIPTILLKLDRDRAIEYLTSEELLSVRFGPVWRILEAFERESVKVPRARVLTIIADSSKEPIEYPMANVVEAALPLVGVHRNAEDLVMLERFLDHEDEKVSRGAIKAIYRFHRYYEVIRDPWDVVQADGWEALTEAEKHICAITELDAEVNNGGFAQYYFNSSGDHWQAAQDGLAAIGAIEHRGLMSATVEAFGDSKPLADRNPRTSQLSKLVRKQEDPFSEQDSAWYSIEDENLDRLIFKYNMENLDCRQKNDQSDDSVAE